MFDDVCGPSQYQEDEEREKLTIAVTSNENDVQIMEMFDRKAFIYRNHSVCFLFFGSTQKGYVVFCWCAIFVRAVTMEWRHIGKANITKKKSKKNRFFSIPNGNFIHFHEMHVNLYMFFVIKFDDSNEERTKERKKENKVKQVANYFLANFNCPFFSLQNAITRIRQPKDQ